MAENVYKEPILNLLVRHALLSCLAAASVAGMIAIVRGINVSDRGNQNVTDQEGKNKKDSSPFVRNTLIAFGAVFVLSLPIPIIRRNGRRLIVGDRNVTLKKGSNFNVIPIPRIDNVNVNRLPGRLAGQLLIFSGGGVPTKFKVGRVLKARDDIDSRIDAFHNRGARALVSTPQSTAAL